LIISAWHIVKAARQVLGYAVAVGLLDTNPAKAIPNPEPKRTEVLPFGTLAEVEAVVAELLPHYRALPLHVRRVVVGGNTRPYGKPAGALRVVPLSAGARGA